MLHTTSHKGKKITEGNLQKCFKMPNEILHNNKINMLIEMIHIYSYTSFYLGVLETINTKCHLLSLTAPLNGALFNPLSVSLCLANQPQFFCDSPSI